MFWSDRHTFELRSPGATQAGSPCDPRYFEGIRLELEKAYLLRFLEIDEELVWEQVEKTLATVGAELTRLRKYPGLFSSQSVREEFFQEVRGRCDSLLGLMSTQEVRDKKVEEFFDGMKKEYSKVNLPAYDEQRKPWQQFLHMGAPGSGVDTSSMAGPGCTQVLPMSVVRIVLAMNEENKSIVRDIEAVRNLSEKPSFTNFLA